MTEKQLVSLGFRSASAKGGSLSITIPIQVIKKLGLKAGDSIVFLLDPEDNRVIVEKISTLTTPSGLSFSISKELAKKLLANKLSKTEESEK